MLARLLHSTASLLRPALGRPLPAADQASRLNEPSPLTDPSSDSSLASTMVQTRRQSRGETSKPGKEVATSTPEANTRKRKNASVESPLSSSRKRKRLNDAKTAEEENGSVGAVIDASARRATSSPSRAAPMQSQQSWFQVSPDQDSLPRPTVAVVVEKKASAVLSESGEPAVSTKPKSKTARQSKEKASPTDDPPISSIGQEHGKKSKASHLRFGSEEPKPQPAVEANVSDRDVTRAQSEEVEPDSEDEAPEAQSLDTGRIKAQAAALEKARARERHDEAVRARHKRRDELLKLQAATSKRKQQQQKDKTVSARKSDFPEDGPRDPPPGSLTIDESALPALLPDEILAIEPMVRPPTPPPASESTRKQRSEQRSSSSKRHTLFDSASERNPNDVVRGSVKVRVLESTQPHLPPKANKASKLVKEGWLLGLRRGGGGGRGGKGGGVRGGKGGGASIERRPMRGGFVRR